MVKAMRALLQRTRLGLAGQTVTDTHTTPIRIGTKALHHLRTQYVRIHGSTRGISKFITEKVEQWAKELESK